MSLHGDIDNIISQTEYGDVLFQVRRVNGKNNQLVTFSYDKKRYPDNTTAVKEIVEQILKLVKSGQTGSITFTVQVKQDRIKEVIYETMRQKYYE